MKKHKLVGANHPQVVKLIGSSFGKVTWSSIAHLAIMIPTAQKKNTLVGDGFNHFEKTWVQNGFIFPQFSGWKIPKCISELPPLSPVSTAQAYPESARLLKDVNKSSLATPGETNVVTRR